MGFAVWCFGFFFLMYVFSGAALGLPTESDFSIYLCIFGILTDYSLGYLMYISCCPVVFLMLLCYRRVLVVELTCGVGVVNVLNLTVR